MKEKNYDLTNGPIINKLLMVAIPIMGVQLMQMAYNLTDMFWLGKTGSDSVAASGLSGMYLWLSVAFVLIGQMGANIGVSQYLGRQDKETAAAYGQHSLWLSLILGAAFGGMMLLFPKELIGVFGVQSVEVETAAAIYMRIVAIGIIPTFISGTINACFTASGNSKLTFYVNAAGLVINMILDPLMILVFDLGVSGAALATIIGQITVCVLFIICIKKAKGRPFEKFAFRTKLDKQKISQIFKWSLPIALESGLFTLLAMVVSRIVNTFGTDAVAVQQVGTQMESLSWLIGGGFASAVTAFIGQNYGGKKWERIHQCFRIGSIVMLVWGIIVTLGLYFGGYHLTGLFLQGDKLQTMGASYLHILALCQVFMCVEGVSAGMFRGCGNTVPPSAISIISNVVRVPLAYLLSQQIGLEGIYWAVCITCIGRGIIIVLWRVIENRKIPQTSVDGEILISPEVKIYEEAI